MPIDARPWLPLKPLVYEVLLALTEGERHGWSLVREIQTRTGGDRILPANFYRTLRGMLADGLIEEAGPPRTAYERRGAPGSPRARTPGGVQGAPPIKDERRGAPGSPRARTPGGVQGAPPIKDERRGAPGSPRARTPGGVQGAPPIKDDERRRYFRISSLGRQAAQLEARRLTALVSDARTRRLLKGSS